jgi:hypothetical protein
MYKEMKIVVTNQWFQGREYFEFTLCDGPDGSERARGYSVDLIEAFTKIIEWREMIARDYKELPPEGTCYDPIEGPTPSENTNGEQ